MPSVTGRAAQPQVVQQILKVWRAWLTRSPSNYSTQRSRSGWPRPGGGGRKEKGKHGGKGFRRCRGAWVRRRVGPHAGGRTFVISPRVVVKAIIINFLISAKYKCIHLLLSLYHIIPLSLLLFSIWNLLSIESICQCHLPWKESNRCQALWWQQATWVRAPQSERGRDYGFCDVLHATT